MPIVEHSFGICEQDCVCNCSYCYEFKKDKGAIYKIKEETTIGTAIDDGEDGCFIQYSNLSKHGGLVSNSASYDDNKVPNIQIRKFESGATRDTNVGKLEYARFISPIVLKRFAEYMDLHRKQTDGNLRDPDNWQNLFGDKHEDVCMDSLWRHLMDVWLINKGSSNEAREDIESALCAIMFNVQAWLFKVLKDKQNRKEDNESK